MGPIFLKAFAEMVPDTFFFSRKHSLTHDDFEMLVVAKKGEKAVTNYC